MSFDSLLIANRGEIAIRIARAAADLGIRSVAVFSEDDAGSPHVRAADAAAPLAGSGPRAYLDGEALAAVAQAAGCGAVHPGYGFLSENAGFAALCAERGLRFVGPRAEVLALFGDKAQARVLAAEAGASVLKGTGPCSLEEARAFLGQVGAVMVKAVAGGGGRGMRPARTPEELEAAWAACAAEAEAAFGNGALYVERWLPRARHLEVQAAGDGERVVHLWERECSVQRRSQKLVETAPAAGLDRGLRAALTDTAVRLAGAARLDSLATLEFLLDPDTGGFFFIEANPRLQVEHTVTEEVTGVDLVQLQLRLAMGERLADLGLSDPPPVRGAAVQARVCAESLEPDGTVRPSAGVLTAYEPPSGPGVRVDGAGAAGWRVTGAYDSLLAKVVARGPDLDGAARRARRALAEFRIEGVRTNTGLLQAVLADPAFAAGEVHTRWLEEHAGRLAAIEPDRRWAEAPARAEAQEASKPAAPAGSTPVAAPLQGLLVSVLVEEGEPVWPGRTVAVLEAMKMQHTVEAAEGGFVRLVAAVPGEVLAEGAPVVFLDRADVQAEAERGEAEADLDHVRPDLAHVLERHAQTLDVNRPDAVTKRRRTGHRTARENLDDLFDPGSFVEYGALAVAAQRRRRSLDDLMANTPADGLVTGLGAVNGALFPEDRSRCMGLAYDYTVLAGTQGYFNHKKTDRVLKVAEELALPVVFYCEGGGGRPGDTDAPQVAGLDVSTFELLASLSGLAPRIGVASGRCFAGNAVFWGCCDVTIATRDSNIGLGGPAMIEGGGLGVYTPEDVGPSEVQTRNGVIDILAEDEAEATALAKQVLGCFQGRTTNWSCADQRRLRRAVPEDRLRVYDVRGVVRDLADEGSAVELRPLFGVGVLTWLARIEGRPVGVMANNPKHLGGAIDSDASDKAARFMQLCDAFDLPIVSLCDTPGFMVGPDSEKTAAVRHGSRLFVTASSMTVPVFTVVLRKGYGLGAQAMARGGFHSASFIIAWPTGEFGGMGLEGAVRLAYRKELEAIADPAARDEAFRGRVAQMYEAGKATSMARHLEIDAVIDPAETRRWIVRGLASTPPAPPRTVKKRPMIDTW